MNKEKNQNNEICLDFCKPTFEMIKQLNLRI